MSVKLPNRSLSRRYQGISRAARTHSQVSSQSNWQAPVAQNGEYYHPLITRFLNMNTDHSIMIAAPNSIPPTATYLGMHSMAQEVDSNVLYLRSETLRRVQNAIRATFGYQYSVEVFGSTMYGVSSPTSDLDFVVIVGTFTFEFNAVS